MKVVGVATPAWTILGDKKKPKFEGLEIKPDENRPGIYSIEPADVLVYNKAPEWKIGSQKRGKWMISNPYMEKIGPGSYEIIQPIGTGPSTETSASNYPITGKRDGTNKPIFWKSEKRFKQRKDTNYVAPDTYDPIPIRPSAPKRSFGYKFDYRPASANHKVGPGQYDLKFSQKEITKEILFTRDKRKPLDTSNRVENPGPGQYFGTEKPNKFARPRPNSAAPISRYSSRKGTFGERSQHRFKKLKNNVPGAGAYEVDQHTILINVSKKAKYAGRVEVDKTIPKIKSIENHVPGPGSYNPIPASVKETAPGFSFGLSKRNDLARKDDYSYGDDIRDEAYNRIRMKERKVDNFISEKQLVKKPRTTFTTGPRTDFAKRDIANTGDLAQTKRNLNDETLEHYNPKWEDCAPKWSFKGKRDIDGRASNFLPGPGAYYADEPGAVGNSGLFFSIGTSQRPRPKTGKYTTPGPGEYNTTCSYKGRISTQKGLRQIYPGLEKGIKIGKGSRKPIYDNDPEIEIGPGEYDIKSTVPQLQPWEEKAQREAAFKIALD